MKYSLVALVFVAASLQAFADVTYSYNYVQDWHDVNKEWTQREENGQTVVNNSCWLTSAANLLGAAGYGDPHIIYGELIKQFGETAAGWQHDALDWYVEHNRQKGNLYTEVTSYTQRSKLTPSFIISELLRGQCVTIGAGRQTQQVAHAFDVWGYRGDDADDHDTAFVFTESEFSTGLQTAEWGEVDGEWWFYFDDDWWKLGYVATLCPIPEPGTLLLVVIGFAGIAAGRRRRKRS